MTDLFAYGSLIFPSVRKLLGLENIELTEATLPGFERVGIKGRTYPIIVSAAYSSVYGALCLNLSQEQMALLDRFEEAPNLYRRTRVEVIIKAEPKVPAETYTPGPLLADVELQPWDPRDFEKYCLPSFLRDVFKFMEEEGKPSNVSSPQAHISIPKL